MKMHSILQYVLVSIIISFLAGCITIAQQRHEAKQQKDFVKLFQMLKEAPNYDKLNIADSIIEISDFNSINYLKLGLQENSAELREKFAFGFCRLEESKVMEQTANLLKDENLRVRASATRGLMQHLKASDRHLTVLIENNLLVNNTELNLLSAEALMLIGNDAGHKVVRNAVNESFVLTRQEAIRILGLFTDPDDVKLLAPYLNDPNFTFRKLAKEAIEKITGQNIIVTNTVTTPTEAPKNRPVQQYAQQTSSNSTAGQLNLSSYFSKAGGAEVNQSTAPLQTAVPLTYHALVIGIDQYKKITKLKTAISDAQTVASVLKDDYGFIVKTLLNPTRAEVINAISEYRKQLTTKDGLLIYYAGHGWLDKEADEGYWLPVDATEDNEANWISTSSNITASLRAMEARHVLVVADSCYSGKLTRGLNITPKSPSQISRLQEKKARKVIASGGLEPVADSNGKEKHSVFASAFLKALRENNQIMTSTDLFSTVRTSVIRNADQTPEFGVIHKAGDDGGDFVFVKKR
jgi:uncharacterized caspase-like protein/HEAT repeat protein